MAPENARSRSGCISCRTRRKKCDERWDAQGSCARCVTSNFVCRRPVLTDIVARRAQRKAAAAADGSSLRSVRPPTAAPSNASSSSQAASTSPPPPSTALAATHPPAAMEALPLTSPSSLASVPPPSLGPGSVAGPSNSQPAQSSLTLPVALSPATPPIFELGAAAVSTVSVNSRSTVVDPVGFRSTTAFPPSPDWSNLDFLASFPEFEALLASQGFAADSLSAPASPAPFSTATTAPSHVLGGGRSNATLTAPTPLSQEQLPEPVEEIERDAHFEGALVLKSVGVEKGVADVYNVSWNAQFCRYLPAEVVQNVLRFWAEICGDVPLTRAASTMCALLYCHGQERFGRVQKDSIADMMHRYQRRTIALISRTKVPFAHELLTFSDLYYFSFAEEGAAAAYKWNDAAEASMTANLGPAPRFNLCSPPSPAHYTLAILVHVAIFRSIAQGRPHSFFQLSHSINADDAAGIKAALALSAPPPPSSASAKPLKLFLGLPTELIFILAQTNDLAGRRLSLPAAEVKLQAGELEARIRAWRPSTDHMSEMADSVAFIEHASACEVWRHAALIFLYQSVRCVGGLSALIQQSLHQILDLLAPLRPPTDDARFASGISKAFPCFVASLVALPPDRQACREELESCGSAKAYADNLQFIELFWEHIDVTGREPADWREFARSQGFELAFM